MGLAVHHRCTPTAVQDSAIRRSRVRGFTLLEMAIAVSIIGVLGMAVSSAYFGIADVRARARAQAEAEVARQSVRAFMLRNKRLPCPDLSAGGSGAREGLGGGACPAGTQIGWLPYESLGLAPPEPRHRMRYAVARAGTGADLVAPVTDVGDGLDLDGVSRLRRTLMAAANQAASSSRPYLTGTGTPASPENCGNVVANPAFAVIAPVKDRDDSGSQYPGFDGINQSMAATNALCIAAPDRPMDATYDDVVVAESATALLGWLAAQTR